MGGGARALSFAGPCVVEQLNGGSRHWARLPGTCQAEANCVLTGNVAEAGRIRSGQVGRATGRVAVNASPRQDGRSTQWPTCNSQSGK